MDVKYCRHQHEVLVADPTLFFWIDDTILPSIILERSLRIQSMPELKRVLMRWRTLIEDCCRELPLVKAILRHADRSQAFADIVKEIQRCTSVYKVTTRSALEKAEREDWQLLMLELKNDYDTHHDCNAEDCGNMHSPRDLQYCLAAQAMQRFVLEKRGGSEPDHKSVLWSFDPEVVKHHGRPLGSGSFGLVSEVTWLGFKYAQKIFNAVGLHSLSAEAEALGKLNHPHIVKVYAYSEDSLLMDLMCTDLHKFMKSRMKGGARDEPFSLPAATNLMLQIADAVSYLHSQNVAHRDLKSSNILVNPVNTPGLGEDDGFVFAKIADFGMAKVKRDITRYSHLTHNVGTRRWMAPEIFGANIEDDHLEHAFPMKADVYSFGIICFEILTGEEPFIDEPLSTLYSKLTAPIPLRPQLPSSCPTALASLICECWDADPRKRPAFGDVCYLVCRGVNAVIDAMPSTSEISQAVQTVQPFRPPSGIAAVVTPPQQPSGALKYTKLWEVGIYATTQMQGSMAEPPQPGLQSLVQELNWSYVALWSFNPQTRNLEWQEGHWRHSDIPGWNEQYFNSTYKPCKFRTHFGSVGMAFADGKNIWRNGPKVLDNAGSKEQAEFLQRVRISTAIFIPWSDGVLELGTCENWPENLGLMESIREYFMNNIVPTLGQQGSGHSQLSTTSMQPAAVVAPSSFPSRSLMQQPSSYSSLSPLRHMSENLNLQSFEPNSLNQQIIRRVASMNPAGNMSHMSLVDVESNGRNNNNNNNNNSYNGTQTTLSSSVQEQRPFKSWRHTRILAPVLQKKNDRQTNQVLLRRCIDIMKRIPHSNPNNNHVPAAGAVATAAGASYDQQAVMHNVGQHGPRLASSSSPETVVTDGISHDPFDQVPPRVQWRPRGGSRIASMGPVHSVHDEAAMDHMLAERRRRVKQKKNFDALRRLVPITSKADKASVLGDAIVYLKDLQNQIDGLEASRAESERRYETLISTGF